MKTHTKNVVADKIERPIVTILNDIVIKTTNYLFNFVRQSPTF